MKLDQLVGHTFTDSSLLQSAITHSSYSNEFGGDNYERLEYLGDSILGFVVANYLYHNYNLSAGDMSKYRAKLVNSKVLGKLVVDLGINKFVRVGKSIKSISNSIFADVYESVLGAIYLDGGDYNAFVMNTLLKDKSHVDYLISEYQDYKTQFQEFMAQKHKTFSYELVSKTGEGVDSLFVVALFVDGVKMCEKKASSKAKAEQDCAKYVLSKSL